MTNQEKSRETAKRYMSIIFHDEIVGEEDLYNVCMQMAEWKDEQYAKAFAPILIELDKLKQQVKSLLP